MCGIGGQFIYREGRVDCAALEIMREAMILRGPDASGSWSSDDGRVGLVHRRLSIQDLSERGSQPMASEGERYRVVYNGEIYNYPELKEWCEARGAVFRSTSDTEVLLHLYKEEGPDFVSRLRGMFAFALWDDRNRTLMLARDPFGIKPLYYSDDGGQLVFASQVKAVLSSGLVSGSDHNSAGLVSFYLWGYITEPHTLYRRIHALPAGHILAVTSEGRHSLRAYCDPLDSLRGCAPTPVSREAVRTTLIDSLEHHLLSDVPIGLFLSAGVDSGTLCGLTREASSAQVLQAVTLGFREFKGTHDDETVLAAKCAEYNGFEHVACWVEREHFFSERDRLLAAMDQPTVDGVNTYLVSKAVADAGLKVALSGVGGDELFGGYPSFEQVPRAAALGRWVPRPLGEAFRHVTAGMASKVTSPKVAGLLEYSRSLESAYLMRRALFMPWEIGAILGEGTLREGMEALDPLGTMKKITAGIEDGYRKVMALEYGIYLRNCLLRDADWAGMAHSLEIRTPLVDVNVFSALACGIGENRGPLRKSDFAASLSRPLLPEILHRPKTGFVAPVRQWMLNQDTPSAGGQRGLRDWARHIGASFGAE